MHPLIIYILAHAIGIKEAVGRLRPCFARKPDDGAKPVYEISTHLLALASTAVSQHSITTPLAIADRYSSKAYNALDEYSTGTHTKRPFSADSVMNIYKDHLESFDDLAKDEDNAETYSLLLQGIFKLALYVALDPSDYIATNMIFGFV